MSDSRLAAMTRRPARMSEKLSLKFSKALVLSRNEILSASVRTSTEAPTCALPPNGTSEIRSPTSAKSANSIVVSRINACSAGEMLPELSTQITTSEPVGRATTDGTPGSCAEPGVRLLHEVCSTAQAQSRQRARSLQGDLPCPRAFVNAPRVREPSSCEQPIKTRRG